MRKRLLIATAALAFALAACGSAFAASTSPSPASGASSAPAATASTAAPDTGSTPTAADVAAARAKAAQTFVDNGKWVEGKNYFRIEPRQPKVTDTSKVEVVEVFNFGCPACNHAHTIIDKIKASLPAYATMAYLPAAFRPDENWPLYQRTWYAAKALGVARKSYDAMFDATWKSGETASYDLAKGTLKPKSEWPGIQDVAAFYEKTFGIKAKQFVAVANSFAVNTRMKRADKLVKGYGVTGTPTIVVDGKYRFTFRSAGGYAQGVELALWLAAKEAAGK